MPTRPPASNARATAHTAAAAETPREWHIKLLPHFAEAQVRVLARSAQILIRQLDSGSGDQHQPDTHTHTHTLHFSFLVACREPYSGLLRAAAATANQHGIWPARLQYVYANSDKNERAFTLPQLRTRQSDRNNLTVIAQQC